MCMLYKSYEIREICNKQSFVGIKCRIIIFTITYETTPQTLDIKKKSKEMRMLLWWVVWGRTTRKKLCSKQKNFPPTINNKRNTFISRPHPFFRLDFIASSFLFSGLGKSGSPERFIQDGKSKTASSLTLHPSF